MTREQVESLKQDFLEWSGGFEPESFDQISVYIDYAMEGGNDPSEVAQILKGWILTGEGLEPRFYLP